MNHDRVDTLLRQEASRRSPSKFNSDYSQPTKVRNQHGDRCDIYCLFPQDSSLLSCISPFFLVVYLGISSSDLIPMKPSAREPERERGRNKEATRASQQSVSRWPRYSLLRTHEISRDASQANFPLCFSFPLPS